MYDIIKGPNGSMILDIAVPGLRKEDLEASYENGILTLNCISKGTGDYLYKGIEEFGKQTFSVGTDYKVDLITCDSGIARVLLSKRLDLGSKIAIQ